MSSTDTAAPPLRWTTRPTFRSSTTASVRRRARTSARGTECWGRGGGAEGEEEGVQVRVPSSLALGARTGAETPSPHPLARQVTQRATCATSHPRGLLLPHWSSSKLDARPLGALTPVHPHRTRTYTYAALLPRLWHHSEKLRRRLLDSPAIPGCELSCRAAQRQLRHPPPARSNLRRPSDHDCRRGMGAVAQLPLRDHRAAARRPPPPQARA